MNDRPPEAVMVSACAAYDGTRHWIAGFGGEGTSPSCGAPLAPARAKSGPEREEGNP